MAVDNKIGNNENENYRNVSKNDTVEIDIEREKIHINNNVGFEKNDGDSVELQIETEIGEDAVDTNIPTKQANSYAAKKTVAQGMMDIALITANANQLRYIIEYNRNSSTYYLNLFLIVISLILQMAVGVSLIFKGKYDLKGESKHAKAKRINNYVVVGIFLVTIINVFIASFTITTKAD